LTDEDTKREIIDLRYQHKKKIREIVQVVGKPSRDVTAVLKKNEIKQAQTTKDETEYERNEGTQNSYATSFQMLKHTSCLTKEKALWKSLPN
jgi:hypothetical protein